MSIHSGTHDRIEVIICSPRNPVRVVSIRKVSKVQSLQILFPDSPKRFICNGTELSESMDFLFYDIRSGDSIVALPNKSEEFTFNTTQWMHLTRDSDNFSEKVRTFLNPNIASEVARLRDLQMTKIERQPKLFQKLTKPYRNQEKQQETEIKDTLYIQTEKKTEPSTEPLPIFWDESVYTEDD